jgi:hypothetical protein
MPPDERLLDRWGRQSLTHEEAAQAIHSNFNLAAHEAVHAVLLRMWGCEVEIVEGDSGPITRTLSRRPISLKRRVMSFMGPEVYMTRHQITFTNLSVRDDREAVAALVARRPDAAEYKARSRRALEDLFACPAICDAITALSKRLFNYASINPMSSRAISEIVDPILAKKVLR